MNICRLFHTVRYLKPVQIYGRLWFKLYKPKPDLGPAPAARPIKGNWTTPCSKTASFFPPYRFSFLNVTHEVTSAADWNYAKCDKLWLYNLHYFNDLQAGDAVS